MYGGTPIFGGWGDNDRDPDGDSRRNIRFLRSHNLLPLDYLIGITGNFCHQRPRMKPILKRSPLSTPSPAQPSPGHGLKSSIPFYGLVQSLNPLFYCCNHFDAPFRTLPFPHTNSINGVSQQHTSSQTPADSRCSLSTILISLAYALGPYANGPDLSVSAACHHQCLHFASSRWARRSFAITSLAWHTLYILLPSASPSYS